MGMIPLQLGPLVEKAWYEKKNTPYTNFTLALQNKGLNGGFFQNVTSFQLWEIKTDRWRLSEEILEGENIKSTSQKNIK